jgi:hypothetical protein
MPKKDKKNKSKKNKPSGPRTESERLQIVNETKLKLLENDIENDPASKVLWMILDRYVTSGIPVDTKLFLKHRYDMARKFVVTLHNDISKKDVVLIRVMTLEEIEISNKNTSNRVRNLQQRAVANTSSNSNSGSRSMPVGVGGNWNNQAYVQEESDSDEECPELERVQEDK